MSEAKTTEQEQIKAIRKAARLAIATKFFSGEDIPPHLLQSWEAYDSYRDAREQVGDPLPPGGCLVLGFASVIQACMAEMHTNLATLLRLPREAIVVRLDRSTGKPIPVADIEDPKDWIVPARPGQDPKAAVKEHIDRAISQAQEYFRITVQERLFWCEQRRQDLDPPLATPPPDGQQA